MPEGLITIPLLKLVRGYLNSIHWFYIHLCHSCFTISLDHKVAAAQDTVIVVVATLFYIRSYSKS